MENPLLQVVREALQLGFATPLEVLQKLLLATGGETCYRRERITHLLTRYLLVNSPLPMSPSTTYRFKADFAHATFEIHEPETRLVTARNLTDEDVAILQQYGGGHLIEPLPAPEVPADLSKLKKDELVALHADVVGELPPADATKAVIIEAIEAAQGE